MEIFDWACPLYDVIAVNNQKSKIIAYIWFF